MPYRGWLLMTFLVLLAISAIRPWYPQDFFIEHILTAISLALLIAVDRRQTLSNASCTLIFLFLVLHILGAHYTYSHVPYDDWSRALFGEPISTTFGWERNHYDRLVHLAFGLLMVYPARELLARLMPELQPRDWRLLVAAVLVLAVLSKLYELLEWMFAIVMTQDAASLYNGEQGDVRDAHKDMALALLGALIGALITLVVERGRRDDASLVN